MKAINKVRGYRVMAGYSQHDMAKLLKLNASNLYSMRERGATRFSNEEMKIIKDAINERLSLNLTIDELFF